MSSAWVIPVVFALGLVGIGLYALLTMRNVVKLLIGVEIIAKGVSLALLATGWARRSVLLAQSLVITFIVVEVALVATALALIVNIHRATGSLDVRKLSRLKG